MKKAIQKIKDEAGPERFRSLVEAAMLVDSMNGISISGDRDKQCKVVGIISPILKDAKESGKKNVEKVAENIIKEAKLRVSSGMDGEGTYFID